MEDLFDDYPLTHLKQKIFRDNSWKSEEIPLSSKCEHSKPKENPNISPVPITTKVNFVDCEESNGEDDDEEEADTPLLITKYESSKSGKRSVECTDLSEKKPDNCIQAQAKAAEDGMPTWSTFFKSSVEGDDALDNENHVERSGDDKNSQSPKLVSDSDDDSTHISSLNSSQSTHISEQGSQGWDSQADTVLLSSQERRAAEMASVRRSSYSISDTDLPEETKPEGGSSTVNCDLIINAKQLPTGVSKNQGEVVDPTKHECAKKADSQSSSDFEIPSSPGAELPHPAKLHYLYQRLATGDTITALQQD